MPATSNLALDPAAEAGADDAFVGEGLFRRQQAHGREHGHHGAGARAARRSIDLSVGEDRDVAQIGVGRLRGPVKIVP